MKLRKILSMLLAVVMVASATAFAIAESAPATAEQPAAAETGTPAAAETAATAETPVYTTNDMMTMAMSDAYARQAAYAVYAEAFPDSRSIAGVNLDNQIVLLEMLLKANGVALPADTTDVTAPATVDEAYQAVLDAENNSLKMYRNFLSQENLPADMRIIFRSVLSGVRDNAQTFVWQARRERQAAQWQEMLNSGDAKTYTLEGPWGRGQWTVYVYNSNPSDTGAAATDDSNATTDSAAEESVSN